MRREASSAAVVERESAREVEEEVERGEEEDAVEWRVVEVEEDEEREV